MKTTFIVKNRTENFFNSLAAVGTHDAFNWLKNQGIKPKIGNDTFREQVEFNTLYKSGGVFSVAKVEPRHGYKLITIYLEKP